jgi:hypothetical protein
VSARTRERNPRRKPAEPWVRGRGETDLRLSQPAEDDDLVESIEQLGSESRLELLQHQRTHRVVALRLGILRRTQREAQVLAALLAA